MSLDARLAKCEEALRVSTRSSAYESIITNMVHSQQSKNCVKQMLMVDFAKRLAYNPDAEVKVRSQTYK